MSVEATFKYRGSPALDHLTTAARLAGEIFLLADGRPVISTGEYADATQGSVYTDGVFDVPAASGTVFANGEAVYWDASANLAVPVASVGVGDFLVGPAVVAKVSGDLVVRIDLNAAIKARQQKTVAAAVTLGVSDLDSTVFGDTQAGAFSITLPPVASCIGRRITFIRAGTGTNALTLDGDSAETVDGGATYAAMDAARDTVTIEAAAAGWFIVSARVA